MMRVVGVSANCTPRTVGKSVVMLVGDRGILLRRLLPPPGKTYGILLAKKRVETNCSFAQRRIGRAKNGAYTYSKNKWDEGAAY